MQDLEPYHRWTDKYSAEEDEWSPFFGKEHSAFEYTNTIYNYYIHPLWDEFGSQTLYLKVLIADYDEGYAIIEMIGEWNDCLYNDIMFFKRDVIDKMIEKGIFRYIIICENVLNFHGSDDSYYEEWYEDISEEDGWIAFINTLTHVEEEMTSTKLSPYCYFGPKFNEINWRPQKPEFVFEAIEGLILGRIKRLN
jgi:hypothetical protein